MIIKAEQSDSNDFVVVVRAEQASSEKPGYKLLCCHSTYCMPAICSWGLAQTNLLSTAAHKPLWFSTAVEVGRPFSSLVTSGQESNSPAIHLFKTVSLWGRKKEKKSLLYPLMRAHYGFQNRNPCTFGKMTILRLKIIATLYY